MVSCQYLISLIQIKLLEIIEIAVNAHHKSLFTNLKQLFFRVCKQADASMLQISVTMPGYQMQMPHMYN